MKHDETGPRDDSGVAQSDAPGPADHGGQGGMATREQAPELAWPKRPDPEGGDEQP